MKKIITVILTACVALCAIVWSRSVEVGDLLSEPIKSAVIAEIENKTKEIPPLIISAENNTLAQESDVEIEPIKQSAVATVNSSEPSQLAKWASKPISSPAPASIEPKPRTIAVVEGVKSMWIPGFGWVKDL